jgi:hypothetical protein
MSTSYCLILLGALMTDINFNISPTPIEQSKSIYVTSENYQSNIITLKNPFTGFSYWFVKGTFEKKNWKTR